MIRALAVLLSLMLTAPAQAQAPAAPKPTGMKLLPDTQRGHFAEPLAGNVFPETQQRQLMLVTFDKAASGQTLHFAIRAVNTTASGSAVIFSGEAAVNAEGSVPLQVRLPRNWPVGQYDVRITQGGQPVALLPYRVEPDRPRVGPITIPAIAIERVVAPGKTEPAEPVRTGYRHLNFSTAAQGANTEGVNLTWILTAVETASGSAEVNRLEIPGRLIENTELQFDVSLPRDWPVGRYRIDLLIDGKQAGTKEFKVEP